MSGLPESYKIAGWRNTTPLDLYSSRIGVGFNFEDGEVVRIALDRASAVHLFETLGDYLNLSHSPKSSGMSSLAVSYPPVTEKV